MDILREMSAKPAGPLMPRLQISLIFRLLMPMWGIIVVTAALVQGQEQARLQGIDSQSAGENSAVSSDFNDERIRQLITDLASPNFPIRQKATENLFRLGKSNRDLLIQAARQPDREVAKRAGEILKIYELGIDSQTPPEIGNLVLFFNESGLEVRGQILSLLGAQNRFRLVFDLLDQVADAEKQHELYLLAFGLNDILLRLARENQWDDVEYLLAHPITLKHDPIPCTYYHLVSGKLDELTTRLENELLARQQDGKTIEDQDHLTLASLCRIQRNYDEAYSHAEEIEDTTLRLELIRQILMERGDWQSIADRMVLPEENLNPQEGRLVFTLPQQVLVHRFLNDEDQVRELLSQLTAKSVELTKQDEGDENAKSFRRLVVQLALAVSDWTTASKFLDRSNRLETFELLSYLNRSAEAFESVEVGRSLDERIVWTRRRIRNMQSLEKKIQRQEENDLDSDAATEDLTKTWNLCCEMVRQLGSFGFRKEALFHYRELFDAIGEGRTVWQRRGDVIEGMMVLGEYAEVWKLIERSIPEAEYNQLMTFLFPFKRTSAEYWNNQLVKRYPIGLTRLQKIAALVNSPLAGETRIDVDEELSIALGKSKSLAGKLDFQVARILEYHGRTDESWLHLTAASSLADVSAREQLAFACLERGDYATAAEIYDQVFRQQHGALNAMMAAEAYSLLGQSETSALRNTIAFVYWHESFRGASITSSFAELNRLHRMKNFLQVYVCVPGSDRVADERYRSALCSSLQKHDPVNEAICLQIMLINLFKTDNPSSRRLTWWAQTARQLTLARATAEIANSNFGEAMEELLAYNDFRPGDPDIAEKLLPAFDAAGETERADELFDLVTGFYFEMLRQYPGSPLYHNNYAWICACGKRRLQYAMRHCEIALEATPLNSSYLDTLAEVYYLQGNIDKAIETSRQCTLLDPIKRHYQNQLRRFREARATQ
jgi:tetratricopeptide (TPR) repeat protein